MTTLVAGSNCDGFFHPDYTIRIMFVAPARTIEGLVAGRQAAVTTADANMSFRVRERAILRAVVCLGMDGCCFEHLL
jgi:hypothetical protein